MSKDDASPQACIRLAKRLWKLVRTEPHDIAELLHTNSAVVEILRAGLDPYVEQVRMLTGVTEDDEKDEDDDHD